MSDLPNYPVTQCQKSSYILTTRRMYIYLIPDEHSEFSGNAE